MSRTEKRERRMKRLRLVCQKGRQMGRRGRKKEEKWDKAFL